MQYKEFDRLSAEYLHKYIKTEDEIKAAQQASNEEKQKNYNLPIGEEVKRTFSTVPKVFQSAYYEKQYERYRDFAKETKDSYRKKKRNNQDFLKEFRTLQSELKKLEKKHNISNSKWSQRERREQEEFERMQRALAKEKSDKRMAEFRKRMDVQRESREKEEAEFQKFINALKEQELEQDTKKVEQRLFGTDKKGRDQGDQSRKESSKEIIEPTREDVLGATDSDAEREMEELRRDAKKFLDEEQKKGSQKDPSGKELKDILNTFGKRKRGPGTDHDRQHTAPDDDMVFDVDIKVSPGIGTTVPSVGVGDSVDVTMVGEDDPIGVGGAGDYAKGGADYAKAAGVISKPKKKKDKKAEPPKKDTSQKATDKSKPQTSKAGDKKQDASKKTDDERVVALHVKTDEVTHNGKKFLKLVDPLTASCVVRKGGDEIMVEKQKAVDRLIKHGFFVKVPGVGLVATSKYSGFGGYTESYFEHAKEDAGRSDTKKQECLQKLAGCLKKCTPQMRAREREKG